MCIEIKKLVPELAEDYIRFFDVTPHDDNNDDHKCYCVGWCTADHRKDTDFSTVQNRRTIAKQYVMDGTLQGYLAYQDGEAVGWCNANEKDKCRYCDGWLRFMQSMNTEDKALRVKSVFCFVIAPKMQRHGIATKLLERVCKDAAEEGYDVVEGYPQKDFVSIQFDFAGPITMFHKLGFQEHSKLSDNVTIVRKHLK